MIKKIIFLSITFFLSLDFFATTPSPTHLPTYPQQKEAILVQKRKMDEHKKNYPIIWNLQWYTGIQYLNMRQFPNADEISLNMSELVFYSNQYKGAIISVDISDLFSIYSNIYFGFTKENFPKKFSTQTLPYQFNNLSSFEADIFAAKSFPLKFNFTFAPYTGYTFSQYKLKPISQNIIIRDRTYHSMIIGGKIIFRPHRLFFIETSLSFSPLTYIDNDLISLFQINYEANFTFITNYFTFSLVLASRNNIEYEENSPETSTLVVSKTGFRFKLSL